jgi:hypothetical protein
LRGIIFDIGDKKRIYEMDSWQITEQIFRGGADVAPREAVSTVTLGLRVGPELLASGWLGRCGQNGRRLWIFLALSGSHCKS